jgi:PTS system mannose-specific IIB component
MTIALARVDNRLVHGQILAAWAPALDADVLLVVDDEAAHNTLVRSAMEMAIPPELQFEVTPVAEAAAALRALPPKKRVLLLVRDVADAAHAVESGLPLTALNLGNVHFSHGRQAITQAVHLSPVELGQLSGLESRGIAVELRTLPRDTPLSLADIRHRMEPGRPA